MREGAARLGRGGQGRAGQPGLVDLVRGEVGGPRAGQRPRSSRSRQATSASADHWGWNWSAVKTVLEWLFYVGEVTSAYRNAQFERVYDLPERVLPAAVLARPTPTVEESVRGLVRRAAAALGVATRARAARLLPHPARRRPSRPSPSWSSPASCSRSRSGTSAGPGTCGTRPGCPGAVHARALLSPFDSLVFERARLEELFGFSYRIEIYVPGAAAGVRLLRLPVPARRPVRRPGRPQGRPGPRGAAGAVGVGRGSGARPAGTSRPSWPPSSPSMAAWQGLSAVEVLPRGDLAATLDAAVRVS